MSVSNDILFSTQRYAIKDAGVDWLTITCSERGFVPLLENLSFVWLTLEESAGNRIRPWSMSGFHGFHCGAVSFGELNGTLLLRLSGPCAQANWMKAFLLSTNVSRIDLQVTIEGVPNCGELIRYHSKQATAHFANWRRPPAVHLWKSNDGSATLYLNRRISEQFGRVYDKFIESKLDSYRGCLRYEAEFKGDLAVLVARSISQNPTQHVAIVNRVSRFFRERGISPSFDFDESAPIGVPATRSDVTRQLAWLGKSVRHTVQGLVAGGKLDEVLTNLGLAETVQMRSALSKNLPG